MNSRLEPKFLSSLFWALTLLSIPLDQTIANPWHDINNSRLLWLVLPLLPCSLALLFREPTYLLRIILWVKKFPDTYQDLFKKTLKLTFITLVAASFVELLLIIRSVKIEHSLISLVEYSALASALYLAIRKAPKARQSNDSISEEEILLAYLLNLFLIRTISLFASFASQDQSILESGYILYLAVTIVLLLTNKSYQSLKSDAQTIFNNPIVRSRPAMTRGGRPSKDLNRTPKKMFVA